MSSDVGKQAEVVVESAEVVVESTVVLFWFFHFVSEAESKAKSEERDVEALRRKKGKIII